MIQGASCEQALIKANRKSVEIHQSKARLFFKTYTLEFKFDRYLEHMVSYQDVHSGLPSFMLMNSAFSRFFAKMTGW